jgi:hypothetical protein
VKTSSGGAYRTVLSALSEIEPDQQLALLDSAGRAQVIRAQARWNTTTSPRFHAWMTLARFQLPDFTDLVAARLQATPRDVALLRYEQDAAAPETRAAVCARHQALAASQPDDADLSYVAIRCMADSVAQTRAFVDGHQRWPKHGWFAYAAGYHLAELGQWQDAAAALTVAQRALPSLPEYVAIDVARLYRMIDAPVAQMARVGETSNRLKFFLALEKGVGIDSGPLRAYAELARGQLTRAVELAGSDSATGLRVLLLAAASDGADASLMTHALAVTPGSLDDDTRWAVVGLRARRGLDYASLIDSTDAARWPYDRQLLAFVRQLRGGARPEIAERALRRLAPVWRGHAYSVGAVILGARAPAVWRRHASRLLFATERPYFR